MVSAIIVRVMVTVMAMDTVTAMVMATGTKRKNKNYIPDDPTEIRHIDEVLKLLQVMTGDERYLTIFQERRCEIFSVNLDLL